MKKRFNPHKVFFSNKQDGLENLSEQEQQRLTGGHGAGDHTEYEWPDQWDEGTTPEQTPISEGESEAPLVQPMGWGDGEDGWEDWEEDEEEDWEDNEDEDWEDEDGDEDEDWEDDDEEEDWEDNEDEDWEDEDEDWEDEDGEDSIPIEEVEVIGHPEDPEEDPEDWEEDEDWDDEDDEDEDWGYEDEEDEGEQNNDPFQRDVNGKIIAVPTDVTSSYTENGITLTFEEVKLQLANGQEITAYKTVEVKDQHGNTLPLDPQYTSNCFGLAVADGEYWFWDNTATPSVDEFSFTSLLNTFYEECLPGEATIAVAHYGTPYHAGIVNSDGTITAKGGIGEEDTFNNEDAFRYGTNDPDATEGPYTDGEVRYYKPK